MTTASGSAAAPTSTPSSVLEGLETDVTKTLQSIQKGIAMLDDRRAALMSAPSEDGAVGDFKDGDWDDEAEDAAAPARS